MASWDSLPAELRLIILEYVAGTDPNIARPEPRENAAQHAYRWAPYAAVSRDWQVFFERRTFASIALFNNDVQPFCDAVGRCADRLAYVVRLRLTVDLPEYTCAESETNEDAATVKRNNVVFTRHLWSLLRALAAWRTPEQDEQRLRMRSDHMFCAGTLNTAVGIQLELGARSISDTQHAFRDYRLLHPHGDVLHPEAFYQYMKDTVLLRNSAKHGWGRGIRKYLPPPAAMRRVLGERPLELDADGLGGLGGETKRDERYVMRHKPPAAAIVCKLVLARRFYRAVHPATLSHLLRVCFPRARYVHLEPWRPVDAASLGATERGYCTLLANLPPSLLHLSILLDTNNIMHRTGTNDDRPSAILGLRRPSPRLGRQLAESSGRLAVINVAFLAEAADFFAAVASMPGKTWPRLTTIILTSSTLQPTSSPADIAQLLLAAAAAAMRMPQLRRVELWFSFLRNGCAFTVEEARLRLRATWDVAPALTADVVHAWQTLSQKWTHQSLRVETEIWAERARTNMHGRRFVLRSDTLAGQMMFEQSREEMLLESGPMFNHM